MPSALLEPRRAIASFAARLNRIPLAMLVGVLLAACGTPPAPKIESAGTFYPPLPNPVRIQHLATIAGEGDLSADEGSGFARFVVGEDSRTQRLRQPYGVALYRGKIYVVDTGAPGLAVFDLLAKRFELITGGSNGRMRRPINVSIDEEGFKFVTDTGRNQVLVFDASDRFVAAFGTEGQFKPVDTAIIGDRLYVVDIQHHSVQVLNKRTGAKLSEFGKPGAEAGEMFHPTNIAVGPDGDLYIVETSNFRVQRFTPEGRPVRTYGQAGNSVGNFARPKGIAIDRSGRMYVSDAAFENVQMFDVNGRLLLYFGQPGGGAEGLNLPTGVSIDYDNVDLFRRYADPNFQVEYLILVASQFGPNKIDVFGFGKMRGLTYPPDEVTSRTTGQATLPR